MPSRIRSFGGSIQSQFQPIDEEAEPVVRRREIWFDRDFNGRWLVWVADAGDLRRYAGPERPVDVGALIVRDPAVAAFLEQLGDLLLEPQQFAHEPIVGE